MAEPPISVDPLDRRLLLALMHRPTAPFAEFAEGLPVGPAALSARYRRLRRHSVVRVVGRTLPGFDGGHAYLARAQAAPAAVARLAAAVAAEDNSRWVRISRDGSELMCGVVTHDPARDPVLVGLPSEPALRSLDTMELLHVWGAVRDAVLRPSREIDALDSALMAELAVDGRGDLRGIAARLGVDTSTVSRRRRRLVEDGILYFEADVHPAALGGTGDAMLWMSVPPGRIRTVGAALRSRDDVRFTAATSGRCDLVSHVQVLDGPALVDFVDGVLADLGVAGVEIVPMGRSLKRNAV
ncbi:AsnC family transcriptional regulator [Tomitella gaofuii]|uniref:AsnC family transcriptional regulator n=1 Tax=Tomitella gaofuii TaxID=2760083 RepID=UPI0015F81DDC|nr:AsnC family transcriptional regulator [Tomitella gaofuii]